MNYAKFIVGVICAGENVEDSRTPYPFVINDKGSLLSLHRFTEYGYFICLPVKRVDMSLLLEGLLVISNK